MIEEMVCAPPDGRPVENRRDSMNGKKKILLLTTGGTIASMPGAAGL